MPTFPEPCRLLHQVRRILILSCSSNELSLYKSCWRGQGYIGEETSLTIQENNLPYSSYFNLSLYSNCLNVSVFSKPLCSSENMISLAIVVVLSNSIWCPASTLCSANADCMTCFDLTSRWCSFMHTLTILPVLSMYIFPQD